MNLLKETVHALKENGKTPGDVLWVGSAQYSSCTWETFAELADAEYNDCYGSQRVAEDLLVVGRDFWLSRAEYEGSEGWVYNTYPTKPIDKLPILSLTIEQAEGLGYKVSCGWEDLATLNNYRDASR